MKNNALALALASTVALGACSTTGSNDRLERAATSATPGAAVGAVLPAPVAIPGAAVGAAIGGLAGAVWADQNNDGYADGYVQNGQYYAGAPTGYDSTMGRVGMMGMAVPAGVVAGAMVTGMPGAVWADQDNNGQVDGYVQGGRYMAGAPAGYSGQSMNTMPDPAPMATKKPYTAPVRSGERG